MDIQEFLCIFVCSPDRGKTGCFCCHNVDSVSEVCCHGRYTRSYKFHYFVLYIAVFEYCSDDCKSDILWSNPWIWFAVKVNGDDFRTSYIVSVAEKLFYKFAAAFTDCHGSKCSVTGMGVRSEDHFAASCEHFSHELMDNCDVWWYVDSAVFLCCGETEHVVIFVDSSAYCAEGVMAVCKYIWKREFFHSGCFGCLNDSYECDVVGCHCIEFQFQVFHVSGSVMSIHDSVCDGSFS